jgi:hypothetical protein
VKTSMDFLEPNYLKLSEKWVKYYNEWDRVNKMFIFSQW